MDAIARTLGPAVRLGCAVRRVRRDAAGVEVEVAGGHRQRFDKVVVATHADDALALLEDPDPREAAMLGRFRYSRKAAVLHTDAAALPAARAARTSWNCDLEDCGDESVPVPVTYHLNRLEGVDGDPEFCLSLNRPPRGRRRCWPRWSTPNHGLLISSGVTGAGLRRTKAADTTRSGWRRGSGAG